MRLLFDRHEESLTVKKNERNKEKANEKAVMKGSRHTGKLDGAVGLRPRLYRAWPKCLTSRHCIRRSDVTASTRTLLRTSTLHGRDAQVDRRYHHTSETRKRKDD